MAKERIVCEKVGLGYFDSAPCKVTVARDVAASPEQIFATFLDAASWPAWAPPITNVEWTSPFPLEVGSTRTVTMWGGLIGFEEFIAWEPSTRMAFRFNESVEGGPIAFAEDYHVTDLGGGGSNVSWTMAMTLPGFSGRITPVIRTAMTGGNALMLRRFAAYVEKTVGA